MSRSSRATRTPQEVRDEAARIRALSASPLASPVPTPPALVQSDEEVQPPREEQGNGNIILFPGTRTMLGKPVSSEDVVAAQRKQR